MKTKYFFPSLTRIADLHEHPFEVRPIPRKNWALGDYVAGQVNGKPHTECQLELASGRMLELMEGDLLIGAFGNRAATLAGVGDWEGIGSELIMEALTSAGLLGKSTSVAYSQTAFTQLTYMGHVIRADQKLNMRDFVRPAPHSEFDLPVILLVGTSMSSGKTTTGRRIVHWLKDAGLRVVGAKLTGAGRYRDILAFGDAGADYTLDFVDAGLPSTMVPESRFRETMSYLLDRIAALRPDVVVAEAGASPLEPYNGSTAVEVLGKHICCTVLAASDPYAVLGVKSAFGIEPDLVTGPAANTTAGIALVERLTGLKALNIMDPECTIELGDVLAEALPAVSLESYQSSGKEHW